MFAVKSPFSKKKEVRRTVSSMGSASKTYAIENRGNSSFHIAGSAGNDDSDANSVSSDDEKNFKDIEVRDSTPEKEEEKKSESPDTQQTADTEVDKAKRMKEILGVALLSDVKSLNKTEQKKLQKYDNLYDRLRKKLGELEMLNS